MRTQVEGMSALAAQYGATAALAGFQLPSTSSKKPYYAIEILQSKMFVNHLLSFDDTLPKLMATDFYDTKNKRIVFDTDKYDANTKKWIGKTENNKYPTKLDVFEVYSKNLSVDLDKLSGFITIRFEHLSPKFAKEFLDLIINELNAVTKQNTLKDAEASMEYLENYLSKTYQKDIKISINALIEAQLKSKMYASTRDEFFLKIIDNPFIPEEKSSPARSLIVILGFFIGCIVSFFIVLLKLIKKFFVMRLMISRK